MAILRSLKFAQDCGPSPCVLESDAAVVVKRINDDGHLDSVNGVILTDIADLTSIMGRVVVTHVPRLTNQVVHGLAKFALGCSEDNFWIEEYPLCYLCIRGIIRADMPD
ncbi:hypothetical protein Ddye_028714 [Dipteronia dyeriana]|uniref:RNase H type-1 domain-containing protein n=1 Tax=Dipteronia dyeriana TaxID=168575 RepID=A0AAD9TD92_9ROSI|nr:hypothetical protein Ddye_028714 [Dipteronia dyeriana]